MDIKLLKQGLKKVTDPRRSWGNKRHMLVDILMIGLCSTLSAGVDFVDMEDFGNDRMEWLKGFLELPNGIPHSDTFRRVFERVCPIELKRCLTAWLDTQREGQQLVNVDGKTIRGSASDKHGAYHVVSAWVEEKRLTLGEIKTDEKSNEIKAIPELLELIDVEGDVVSIDAMGCQMDIASAIRKKKADYLLAVKGNQGTLFEDISTYFDNLDGLPHIRWQGKVEKDHGRIERRAVIVAPASWLDCTANWQDIQTIIRYTCSRVKDGVKTVSNRHYISSLDTTPEHFAMLLRGHWSIENHLHWALDVVFREDASRARKGNSPLTLNVLRKIAIPILHACKVGRLSAQKKMLKAARNPDFLGCLLFAQK
jgi:predicted transposase YbfD/YdcC